MLQYIRSHLHLKPSKPTPLLHVEHLSTGLPEGEELKGDFPVSADVDSGDVDSEVDDDDDDEDEEEEDEVGMTIGGELVSANIGWCCDCSGACSTTTMGVLCASTAGGGAVGLSTIMALALLTALAPVPFFSL